MKPITSKALALVTLDLAISSLSAVVAWLHRAHPATEAHRKACVAVSWARQVRESVEREVGP